LDIYPNASIQISAFFHRADTHKCALKYTWNTHGTVLLG